MPSLPERVSRIAVNDGDRQLRRTSIRFGEDVRHMRLRAGVSQAALGRTIGISRSVICRIEQGDPNVAARIRARVAVPLGGEDGRNLTTAKSGADQILDGMERNAYRALIGPDARLRDLLYRVSPAGAAAFIARQMKGLIG